MIKKEVTLRAYVVMLKEEGGDSNVPNEVHLTAYTLLEAVASVVGRPRYGSKRIITVQEKEGVKYD